VISKYQSTYIWARVSTLREIVKEEIDQHIS